jgi:hypothetical protein
MRKQFLGSNFHLFYTSNDMKTHMQVNIEFTPAGGLTAEAIVAAIQDLFEHDGMHANAAVCVSGYNTWTDIPAPKKTKTKKKK